LDSLFEYGCYKPYKDAHNKVQHYQYADYKFNFYKEKSDSNTKRRDQQIEDIKSFQLQVIGNRKQPWPPEYPEHAGCQKKENGI
jgi:hypothetical protein